MPHTALTSSPVRPRHALRGAGSSIASLAGALSSTRRSNASRFCQCPTRTAIPTTAIGSCGVADCAGSTEGAGRGVATPFPVCTGCGIHSSINKWALMPPNPKPLIAARRGTFAARRCHGWPALRIENGLPAKCTLPDGVSKFATGGRQSCCKASSVLISPALPAAVSRCPIFDLTALSTHWPSRQSVPCHKRARLSNSTASPTGVPVAWHSIRSTRSGDQPAIR